MSPSTTQVEKVLKKKFDPGYSKDVVQLFFRSIEGFQEANWGKCLEASGKMIEAVTRLLYTFAGVGVPKSARKFQAGVALRQIENNTPATTPDTIRVHIPKPCIFVFDVTSNRGSRHYIPGLSPDEMDARAVVPVISWVLSELVRFAGGQTTTEAMRMVQGLMARQFPFFEEIDGKVWVNYDNLSAHKTALLLLYKAYPNRLSRKYLLERVISHGYSANNTNEAFARLRKMLDEGTSGIVLRGNGRKAAETLLEKFYGNK